MINIPDNIIKISSKYELNPEIISRLILKESNGNPYAIRYEHLFYKKYIADKDRKSLSGFIPQRIPTLLTEKRLRAFSFGLMQIMGETARWIGFDGKYLTELLNVDTNIEYGCQYLKHCLAKSKGDMYKALLRYNGGGNKDYPTGIII